MALTPAKPDFLDVTSRAKIRVWVAPTMSTTDTVTVPGVKRVFSVVMGSRPGLVYTSSAAANAGGVVLTLVCTASATGGNTPLVVYGQ